MILEIGFNNYRMFKNENLISFKADKRTKYLQSNITDIKNVGVLKAIGLYGPNNSGKSNIIYLMKMFKNILSGKGKVELNRSLFGDEPIISGFITFINDVNNNDSNWLRYEFSFDSEKNKYLKEKLTKLEFYVGGAKTESCIFEKNVENNVLTIFDVSEADLLTILPNDSPFLCTISYDGKFANLKQWKDALNKCADDIVILHMFNIPIQKTIDMLKTKDEKKINFIKSFVKSADLSIKDFSFNDDVIETNVKNNIQEKVLDNYKNSLDAFKLTTTYGNAVVPSIFFDSTGTKKIEAIASYVYECISEGKLLVVDELDNGLHFTLTRAIVSAFNNMINCKGQIIFTAHDLLLIDCNNLLRKDQIYFLYRDNNDSKLLSLKSLTTEKTGLREGNTLLKRYNHGDFGPVPLPDFIEDLFEVA